MRRLALAAFALALAAPPLRAEPVGRTYAPVTATYDRAGEKDAGLTAFVAGLRKAVEAKNVPSIEAALSRKFAALNCTANPLDACAPGKATALGAAIVDPLQRMRLSFCCGGAAAPDMSAQDQNETMFAILSGALASTSLGANPDGAGEICAPALPRIDRPMVAAAAKSAGVEPENLRVAAVGIPLRDKPGPDAGAKAPLAPGAVAPIVTDLTTATPAGWTAVRLPDGSIGYTDALGFDDLTPAALCFGKENGRWKIVATIQRGG